MPDSVDREKKVLRVEADPSLAVAAAPARVLVAIPCYNEELAIAGLVLRARKHADEVLVVDDGSTDRTVEVARMAGAAVLQNPGNRGKGYGVRRAFKHARDEGYDALVLLDGDGQHNPDEIPALLEPVVGRNGAGVDVALGFRHGEKTQMPLWRKAGKRVLDYATAAGAGVVTDSQCGYRAFGRRAIEEMSRRLGGDGFSVESEQLVVMKEAGLRSENVEVHCRYDGLDGSTQGPVRHAVGVLENVFDLVTSKRPMLFIGVPSATVLLLAFAMMVFTLRAWQDRGVFSIGYALVTATLTLLGAVGVITALILNLIHRLEVRLQRAQAR